MTPAALTAWVPETDQTVTSSSVPFLGPVSGDMARRWTVRCFDLADRTVSSHERGPGGPTALVRFTSFFGVGLPATRHGSTAPSVMARPEIV